MMRRSQGYVDYERVAPRYQQGRSLPESVLERWADAVGPYLPARSRLVVDVGAGTGVFAAAWPRWVSARVVAVEPSGAMVDAARRAAVTAHPAVGYVRATAESLPLAEGVADIAWVSTALHHFVDGHRAVGELARVLRYGGRVFVRAYVPGRTDVGWLGSFPGRHKWEARSQTLDQLVALFRPHGFELTDAREVLEFTATHAEAADWVERMRDVDSFLTALSDKEIVTGVQMLRSAPDTISRLEFSLVVFTLESKWTPGHMDT